MARRRRTKPSLESATLLDLFQEADRRLLQHRKQLDELRGSAARMGVLLPGSVGTYGEQRSLRSVLREIMHRRQMTIHEAAAAAKEAGYTTKSKTRFLQMVHRVLSNHPRNFTRVERGVYRGRS